MFFLKHQLSFLSIIIMIFMLSSCTSPMKHVGKKALEEHTINAVDAQPNSGTWETGNVRIDYTIEPLGQTFLPSASIHIKDSVLMTFNSADFFQVYLIYLDKEGVALSSHDVSPKVGYKLILKDIYNLLHIPAAPQGAVAFTFSYWGIFVDTDVSGAKAGEWEIFFNPFE